MDDGEVPGISDEEILETLMVLFYIASELDAHIAIGIVSIGQFDLSCLVSVTKEKTLLNDWLVDKEELL